MAHFNGKWKLVSSENADAFFAAVRAGEEFLQLLKSVHAEVKESNPDAYIEEFQVDKAANTVQRIVYVRGEKKRDSGTIPFGVEVDGRCHGKQAKITVTMESDTKIIRHEKGEDFASTSTIEVKDSDMTLTLTCGGITATEKYKRV